MQYLSQSSRFYSRVCVNIEVNDIRMHVVILCILSIDDYAVV